MLRSITVLLLFLSALLPAWANSEQALQSLLQQKKFGAAIEAGEQLLSSQPESARAIFLTAYAYQMNRQPEKAETLYRQLISQYPHLPEPRNNLAMIYQARGDYDAASKLLVEAIETHKSYATAYQNLSRIYTGIASEAYRRALSESVEPAKYTHNIELVALTRLTIPAEPDLLDNHPPDRPQQAQSRPNLATLLEHRVKAWAGAWSDRDFSAYASFYSTEYHPNFESHREWLAYRRERILQPEFIRVGVTDIDIRVQTGKKAIVDFKQSFDSPGYSDRVVKRLSFQLVGEQWQIVDERVLSVL